VSSTNSATDVGGTLRSALGATGRARASLNRRRSRTLQASCGPRGWYWLPPIRSTTPPTTPMRTCPRSASTEVPDIIAPYAYPPRGLDLAVKVPRAPDWPRGEVGSGGDAQRVGSDHNP
jgi:hypothetical protein